MRNLLQQRLFLLLFALSLLLPAAVLASTTQAVTAFAASHPEANDELAVRTATDFRMAVFPDNGPTDVTFEIRRSGTTIYTKVVHVTAITQVCIFGTRAIGFCNMMPVDMYTSALNRNTVLEIVASAPDGGSMTIPFTLRAFGTQLDTWMSWAGENEPIHKQLKYPTLLQGSLTVWNPTILDGQLAYDFTNSGFTVSNVKVDDVAQPQGLTDFSTQLLSFQLTTITFDAVPAEGTNTITAVMKLFDNGLGFPVEVRAGTGEVSAFYEDESFIEVLSPTVAAVSALTQSDFSAGISIYQPERIQFSIVHVGDNNVITKVWDSAEFEFTAGENQVVCAFSADGKRTGPTCPTVTDLVGDKLRSGQMYQISMTIVGKRTASAEFLWQLNTAFDYLVALPLVQAPE